MISDDEPVTIKVVRHEAPRDALSLADHALLGFEKREQLRRFLGAHHVPVVADGKTLRFTRADFLAAMARGARVLPARAKRPAANDDALAALPAHLRAKVAR